ncbi:MAG: YicC/YloC family endoribonuclease [Bacteroidales bacterium]
MTQSMTGYHKLSFAYAEKTIHIEIKSLNSKYLDISTRMPSVYKEKELAIRELIHKKLMRGKVEYNIYVDMMPGANSTEINKELFVSYYEQLKLLRDQYNIPMDDNVMQVISNMPDIMKQEREEIADEEWDLILSKTEEALQQVIAYRKDEGKSLKEDVKAATMKIASLMDCVAPFEESRVENTRTRLKANLEKIKDKIEIDEGRFEQELVYYLEKFDINEEKVRLKNHCNYFLETLGKEGPVGKKLGFITQEMGREINTLGSKANDPDIQRIVMIMKEELEKIKEQILNIL